jgi:hypothetical protein
VARTLPHRVAVARGPRRRAAAPPLHPRVHVPCPDAGGGAVDVSLFDLELSGQLISTADGYHRGTAPLSHVVGEERAVGERIDTILFSLINGSAAKYF